MNKLRAAWNNYFLDPTPENLDAVRKLTLENGLAKKTIVHGSIRGEVLKDFNALHFRDNELNFPGAVK